MISAVVHTYNEEKNINRCLSSLYFVDEIVLIDMGSTDKTCQIAKEYKAKIYTHPYTGFVETARNFGISKAKYEWVIILDADEEVPRSLAQFILNEIKNSNFDFYRISRKNIIFNKWIKHSGWWPDYQVRLFRKEQVKWTTKLHGVPLTYGKGNDIKSKEELSIVHYNYQSLDQFIERINRYSKISAEEMYISGERFSFSVSIQKSSKEFINRYLVWEGYKDGVHGLVLSFLQSFAILINYFKLWELERFKEKRLLLGEVEKEIKIADRQKKYWFLTRMISDSDNYIEKIFLKFKRKIALYE